MKRIVAVICSLIIAFGQVTAQDEGLLNSNFGTFSPYGGNTNIGLGTVPLPGVKLSLSQATDQDWFRLVSHNSTLEGSWRFKNSTSGIDLNLGFQHAASGDNNWNLTLTPFAKVGINDDKPESNLQVNGTVQFHVNKKVNFLVRNKEVFIGQPGHKTDLFVNGYISANQVEVRPDSWSDFVFEKEFKLRSLPDLENYIKRNGHLPDLPSEKQVLEQGIELGEMNRLLVQKVEELTLYVIRLQQQNEELYLQLQELRDSGSFRSEK